ncbi:MAG: aliphatic sulfonate ABC transporter substrate-binding protein [Sphaerochaetaceae bacterium]|jgi:NitT/TauT family transport system substrate-binding protein|nr:aliphatic sulfonate ABC transporter substrate-binding protein [Sphaerochaetaceae bacterium]MDD2405864.1 aliphatic sulfonate ABC transporter substrate-binding protein [Sphaerochaetaceae bacterium]NLO69956.1 aliphatic sulfonate ABC transporter substrate-binding protein [Porphyromonadaceae bacterium]
MKKIGMIMVLVIALSISLYAGGASETDSSGKTELVKLRLGYMPNLISASLGAIGIEEGYFEEYGLDVELIKFTSGPPEFAAMAAGDLDAAIIGHGAHLLAIQGQAEIFYFECLGNSDKIMALTSSGIASARDLKGKTIAAVRGTSSEALLNLTLAEAGLTEKDVKIVSMDQNGAASALIARQVDAAALWSPLTVTVSNELGDSVIVVSSIGDFADRAPSPGSWIISEKTIKTKPEIVKRLTKALFKASDFRAANIEKAAEYVAKLIGTETSQTLQEVQTARWFTAKEIYDFTKSGQLDTWYEAEQQMFIDSGKLDAKVPNETYFAKQFMLESYEEMQNEK